jgi:hypothetical protein
VTVFTPYETLNGSGSYTTSLDSSPSAEAPSAYPDIRGDWLAVWLAASAAFHGVRSFNGSAWARLDGVMARRVRETLHASREAMLRA